MINVCVIHKSCFYLKSIFGLMCDILVQNFTSTTLCIRVHVLVGKCVGQYLQTMKTYISLQTPCIEQLDARNTGLTEQVMPMLGRALRLGSQLTVLHLESAIISGRPLMILGTCVFIFSSKTAVLRILIIVMTSLKPSLFVQCCMVTRYKNGRECFSCYMARPVFQLGSFQ